MSYLLTEVAMEMLGWRFYDANGVARPINFEGITTSAQCSGICEGVENLAVSLGIVPMNGRIATSVVQAEADSSSHVSTDIINLDDAGGSPIASNDDDMMNINADITQNIGNKNLLHFSEVSALDTETPTIDDSNLSASSVPFMLKIQHVQGGYDAVKAEEASVKSQMLTNSQTQPPQTSTVDTDSTSINYDANMPNITSKPNPKNISAFIDLTEGLEIGKQLQTEISKITGHLNRHKSIFFAAVPDALKHPPSTFQKVLDSYRAHELKNLQSELKHLKTLRQEFEQKSYTDFGHTYPKYIATCEKLTAREKLSTSKVTVQEMKRKQPAAKKKKSPLK